MEIGVVGYATNLLQHGISEVRGAALQVVYEFAKRSRSSFILQLHRIDIEADDIREKLLGFNIGGSLLSMVHNDVPHSSLALLVIGELAKRGDVVIDDLVTNILERETGPYLDHPNFNLRLLALIGVNRAVKNGNF